MHIQERQNEKALYCFHRALKAIQADLDSGAADARNHHRGGAQDQRDYPGTIFSVAASSFFQVELPSETSDSDDTFVIFDRPLAIPERSAWVERGMDELYMHLVTPVILFNIALAYHLQGLHIGNSSLLTRALGMYVMGYNALRAGGRHDLLRKECSKRSHLAHMAFLNNIGHIHAHFCRMNDATACCKELSRFLCALDSSPAGSNDDDTASSFSLSKEEYSIFFPNVCFFRQEVLTASPAA